MGHGGKGPKDKKNCAPPADPKHVCCALKKEGKQIQSTPAHQMFLWLRFEKQDKISAKVASVNTAGPQCHGRPAVATKEKGEKKQSAKTEIDLRPDALWERMGKKEDETVSVVMPMQAHLGHNRSYPHTHTHTHTCEKAVSTAKVLCGCCTVSGKTWQY